MALTGLFPTVGFQIITEPRSLEDSPGPEFDNQIKAAPPSTHS